MINAAVVGLGIGTHHAEAIKDNDYCRLTHISDLDYKKTERAKKDLKNEFLKVSSLKEQILKEAK